ncbi:zinc C3HC4 type RING finger domain-containing protein, putative [Babesia ovis]|uniref:E3 ubiquitin-protein ligase listerin n=1 Tax=Babesia ovis TaxID=5869 RepID=A0A9W5T7I3_BABOV|nr:zinc C3HC4 type RING finger domain-containing protein, putative [Babesia ovis]
MTRTNKKREERKVRASDFAMYQTAESRPTGLHHIFDAFRQDAENSAGSDYSAAMGGSTANGGTSQSEVLKALDKLTKKDTTTKQKALDQLIQTLDTVPNEVLDRLMPDFAHVFLRLAVVEPCRRIRSTLGEVLLKIASKLKKRMQAHMDTFITHWWVAIHDDAPEVAEAYLQAFNSLFGTTTPEELDRKTLRVLTHYIGTIVDTTFVMLKKDIEQYKRDWLDVFGKVCDNSATISEMHNRLICSVLRSLMKLVTYQKQFGSSSDAGVSVFINNGFVDIVAPLCRSGAIKQRFTNVCLLVEFVKVLQHEDINVAKRIFRIAKLRLSEPEDPRVTFHLIRLLCACSRYNSDCWSSEDLENYVPFIQGILERHKGDFNSQIELYSVFPCVVSYVPPGWLNSQVGLAAVFDVARFILTLMHEKLGANYDQSFGFDKKAFSQLGTSMLYCYYRILLLLNCTCEALVEHIFAPMLKLPSDTLPYAHHFLSHMPRIFTEFIEESAVLRTAGAYDVLLRKLGEMYQTNVSYVFMARVFASLANVGLDQDGQHDRIRSFAKGVQRQLEGHIMHNILPTAFHDFILAPSESTQSHIEDILDVVGDIDDVPHDLAILDAPRLFISYVYKDTRDFDRVYKVLCRILAHLPPVLVDPGKYYHDAGSILVVSLVALQHCDSESKAFEIAKLAFSTKYDQSNTVVATLLLKLIQECGRYSILSNMMLSWLADPDNFSSATFGSLFNMVNPECIQTENVVAYNMFHVLHKLFIKQPCRSYTLDPDLMVNDIVTLYLIGYYNQLDVSLEAFANFCLTLLPTWRKKSTFDDNQVTIFLQLLNKPQECTPGDVLGATGESNLCGMTVKAQLDDTIDSLVNTLLDIQRGPFTCTASISRALCVLRSISELDISTLYQRNAVLFSRLWLGNYETYVVPMVSVANNHAVGINTGSDATKHLQCLVDLFVTTFLYGKSTYGPFEELGTKLGGNPGLADLLAHSFVDTLKGLTYASNLQLNTQVASFRAYILNLHDPASLGSLLRQHYSSNHFMGNFVAAINSILDVPVTNIDAISTQIEICGKNDIVLLTNCLLELGQLIGDSVITTGNALKHPEDLEYISSQLEKLPQLVFDRVDVLRHPDAVSTCWLHYAIMGFSRSCMNALDAVSGDAYSIRSFVISWIMVVLHFCYDQTDGHMAIELFADVLQFGLSHALFPLEELRTCPTEYEFSKPSLSEYIQVLQALSQDIKAKIVTAHTENGHLESIDTHYLVCMLLNVIERLDLELGHHNMVPTSLQDAVTSTQAATYSFLCFLSKSKSCYIYAICCVSRLWHVRFLLDNIANHGGILCKMDLEQTGLYCKIPIKWIQTLIRDNVTIASAAYLNLSQLMFDLVQQQDTNQPGTDHDETEEEPPSTQSYETNIQRGRSAISIYLNVILGPYICKALFRTYDVLLASCEHQDLELCLTSWMSIFVMLHEITESKMFTLKNALVALFKARPLDAGGAMYDALVSHLTSSQPEVTPIDAWWLSGGMGLPEHTEEPILHVLLQTLMLCLENLPHQAERHRALVKALYYKVAKMFPEEVNHVWNVCKSTYVKKQIRDFTRTEVTQRLIEDELCLIKMDTSSAIRITHDADYRNVSASLETKAEVDITLTVKIPPAFPLEPLSFASNDDSGTFKNKHLRWLMMAQSTANREGIFQGLLLWSDNITKFFDGIEECPICYSIVHLQFNTIPSKMCKVCKHKFHTECLYKWFRNAPKAKCPLCQSLLSFNSCG